MSFDTAVLSHIAVGSAAILFYWVTLTSTKGSSRHRAWGRAFFTMLLVVALSVGPVLLMRPGAFDPAYVVQFVYLALCLVTVTLLGWTSIRWKTQPERFRGLHFKVLGIALLVLGGVVLAAGVAQAKPLPIIFSWIGLVYGAAMIRFAWMKAQLHPRWWLGWHLNAIAGLFNAAHGTFLAVMWRWLVDPFAGDELAVTTQLATIAAALAMRLWFGHRRGAPLRFSALASASGTGPPRTPAPVGRL